MHVNEPKACYATLSTQHSTAALIDAGGRPTINLSKRSYEHYLWCLREPSPAVLGGSNEGVRSEVWGRFCDQTSPGYMRHPHFALLLEMLLVWDSEESEGQQNHLSVFLPPISTPLIYQEIKFEWMNRQRWEFRPISTLPSNIPYAPSNQEPKVCLWQWRVQQRRSKGLSQASSRARGSPTHRGLNCQSSNCWMRLPYVCLGCQSFQSEATNIFLAKTLTDL